MSAINDYFTQAEFSLAAYGTFGTTGDGAQLILSYDINLNGTEQCHAVHG